MLTLFLFSVGTVWATDYHLVTSVSQLEAGVNYVIGTSDGSFIGKASKNNNRVITSATISDGVVTATEDMMVLTLGGGTDAWTFYATNYAGGAGYLNATNTTGSNYLNVVADLDVYAYFTVEISGGTTTVTCNGKTSRHILYKNGTTGFACYNSQSGSQYSKPNLYKEVSTATEAYTVSYSTGTGNPTIPDSVETAPGAGIILPEVTPVCTDWSFAGWKETSAVTEETTTAPTLLSVGTKYKPTDDCVLYAVYKRVESGEVSDESVTEDFEKQTAGSTYNSTQTYKAENSNAGLAWTMYYGTVATNDKITGSNSAQMRLYYNHTDAYGYIKTTTPVSGLQSLSFKARVSATEVKMSVW